jgi:hypothetical protein
MCVGSQRLAGLLEQQPAGHAEMHRETTRGRTVSGSAQMNQDVFAVPAYRFNSCAEQLLLKSSRAAGQKPIQSSRATPSYPVRWQSDAGDPPANQHGSQASHHSFDLRQFGHFWTTLDVP